MARFALHLDSATADEARAFLIAFQTTRELSAACGEPTVQIMGIGWHVQTPMMSRARAVAMAAKLDEPA